MAIFVKSMISVWMSTCASILIRIPPTVSMVVSIAFNPGVDTVCSNRRGGIVPLRLLLVVAILGNGGCCVQLLSFCVVLHYFPVFFNRDINVA